MTIDYFVHESAYIDEGAHIGAETRIWHFCHILSGAKVGANCSIGQNVSIAATVTVGDNVKIQNNVSLFDGVTVEDDVFLGPSCVLTNVSNPRSQVARKDFYETTLLRRGCSIGANATIVCGVEIGRYAFVAAGSVVTKNLPDYAFVQGVPAKQFGWMSRHGHKLEAQDSTGHLVCPESGLRYMLSNEVDGARLRCVDLDEDEKLPTGLSISSVGYRKSRGKNS